MAAAGHNLGTVELLALLRDGSLKPDSIAEEMACAGAHPCTAAQIAEARELLGLLQQERTAQSAGLAAEGAAAEPEVARRISSLPEPLALALVRAAGDAQRQDALVELAAAPQKALAKEAKRELQRLKQRGVQVQEIRPRGDPVLKPPPEAEAPACYASSIDAYGERAVWWSRATRGGVEVVQAVVSDVKGILAIDALALSRRNFRDFAKRLPRQGGVVTSIEVPKDHARWLIAQAAEEGSRNGFAPPPAYADALRILGPAPQDPPPPPACVGVCVSGLVLGSGVRPGRGRGNGGVAPRRDGATRRLLPEDVRLRPQLPASRTARTHEAAADSRAAARLAPDRSVELTRGGKPVRGATVTTTFAMLDMEMGQQAYRLDEVRPGVYRRDAPALVMVGHWGLSFEVEPPGHAPFQVLIIDRANG